VIIDAPVEITAAFLSEITAKFVVNPGENFAITNNIQVSWYLIKVYVLREYISRYSLYRFPSYRLLMN
jgi:hypothetical protein